MSIPPSLIILSVILLFLASFVAVGINETLPAFVRSEFDSICTRYFSNMVINGGLASSDVTALRNELTDLGLTNISVNIYLDSDLSTPASPGTIIEWGRKATLLIEATYLYENVSTDGEGTKREKQHTIKYKNSSTILSLKNG